MGGLIGTATETKNGLALKGSASITISLAIGDKKSLKMNQGSLVVVWFGMSGFSAIYVTETDSTSLVYTSRKDTYSNVPSEPGKVSFYRDLSAPNGYIIENNSSWAAEMKFTVLPGLR